MNKFVCTDKQLLILDLAGENTTIDVALRVGCNMDNSILLKAANKEVERNEGLRLRSYKKLGKWYTEILDSNVIDRIEYFDEKGKTKKEVEKKVDSLCEKPLIARNNKKPFEIYQISSDGYDFFLFRMIHGHMDTYAILLTMTDILKEYFSIVENRTTNIELTSIKDYFIKYNNKILEFKNKRKVDYEYYVSEQKRLGQQYYVGCEGRCETKKHYLNLPKDCLSRKYYIAKFDSDLFKRVNDYVTKHSINFCSFYFGIMDIYYSSVNNKFNDISFTFNSNMRSKLSDKKLPLTTANAFDFRNIIDINMSFDNFMIDTNEKYLKMLRHAELYPVNHFMYTLLHYGKGRHGCYSQVGVSYVPFDLNNISSNDISFEAYWPKAKEADDFIIYNMLAPNSKGELNVFYRYADKVLTEKNVSDLHNGLIKIINKAFEDSDISINDLMDTYNK